MRCFFGGETQEHASITGLANANSFVSLCVATSPDLYDNPQSIKYRDIDSKFSPARKALRKKLTDILKPYLDNVITPMVHQRYTSACTSKGRNRYCTPCFSLIRKYKHGQRQSHATHHDGHAIVTVVVSLSDYNVDYRGGLYVSTGYGHHEHVALNKGDAVMHQSSLLHGVKVYDLLKNPKKTERWSWIMWYRDSTTCEDYGHEWFRECADAGDPLCQHLDSTKVGNRPGISQDEAAAQVLELNLKAADGGSGISAVKIARAYMQQLPSALPFDTQKAALYYHRAIQSNNPDGHYGLAFLHLFEVTNDYSGGTNELMAHKDPRVQQTIKHLENAAYSGHAFAMFNLGLVHTFGYANGTIDTDLAGKWFEESGLPEGYFVAANAAAAAGFTMREQQMMKRAQEMGYFTPWRIKARQNTGSGGASGVDLNMPWPPAFDGRRPPSF
jgi:TPR repeat protein